MTKTAAQSWEAHRTDETREVEEALRRAGFQQADAYRYNSASIRVRVVDPRFRGMSVEQRDAVVEPHLAKLPERTQADIVTLLTLSPDEITGPDVSSRSLSLNAEFEDPSPSEL